MVAGLSAAAIVGSFALCAVPAGAAGTATINATGTTGNNLIIGSGSSTTYTMMQQLDTLYNGANQCTMTIDRTGATAVQPLDFSCLTQTQETNGGVLNPVNPSTATTPNPFGDIAVEEPPIGSSNGILQLESARASATAYNLKYGSASGAVNAFNGVNFARSSRSASISSSGDNQGLNFVAYAKDGVDWSHFTSTAAGANCSAAVGRLTTSELKAIWQGQIWNWSQVGGCNAPIIVFSAQEGSGTQSTWKGTLGTDPSAVQSSTFYANCWNNGNTTASGNEGLSLATLQTNQPTNAKCNGPIDIFENETAQLNVNALPAQMINPNSTATGGLNAGATVSGTAGSLTAVYTLPGSSKPLACNQWWLGCTSSGTGSSTVWTFNLPSATSVLARSIFFYSAGIFHHQCIVSGGVNTATTCNANNWKVLSIDPTGATTMSLGSIGTFPGTTTLQTTGLTSAGEPATTCATVAGNPSPCQPTELSILTGSFPSVRSVYNVYVNGQSNATAHMNEATAATLNYIGETGFLCTPRTASITDPNTGVSYLTEIQNTILGAGFYPITAGAASGTVNQTPLSSEGSVGTLGAESMYPSGAYAPYLAHAGGTAAAPSGFCNFTTTSGASGQPVAG
jgi:ABC-type phosphate transport system substrate-binding protein